MYLPPTSHDKHRMKYNNVKLNSKQRKGNPQVLEIKRKLRAEWKADELIWRKSEDVGIECRSWHPGSARPTRGQEMWPWPMQKWRWNWESCIKSVLTIKNREVTTQGCMLKELLKDILEVTRNWTQERGGEGLEVINKFGQIWVRTECFENTKNE